MQVWRQQGGWIRDAVQVIDGAGLKTEVICKPTAYDVVGLRERVLNFKKKLGARFKDKPRLKKGVETSLEFVASRLPKYVAKPVLPSLARGDTVRAFERPDGRISLFVADMADHGTKTAGPMLALDQYLQSGEFTKLLGGKRRRSAAGVLAAMNRQLMLPNYQFVMLSHVIYDPNSGAFEYANAGQPRLMIKKANGELEQPDFTGSPLGFDLRYKSIVSGEHLDPRSRKATFRGTLEKGDSLVLVSDGVTEGWHQGQQRYGSRFEEKLRKTKPTDLLKGATGLLRGMKRTDDTTLVVLQR